MSRSVECWRQGVDVFRTNPCPEAVQVQLFTQSPLWLHVGPLPIGDGLVRPVGLSLAVLFGLALASLPPVWRMRDAALLLLAVCSSATAFALERANVDVVLFLLLMAGIWLGRFGFGLRLVGYGLVLVAGLLKYFPLVGLLLCLREGLRRSVCILLVAVAVLIWLAVVYREELRLALGNIPAVEPFGDGFGAADLGLGLHKLFGPEIYEDLTAPLLAVALGLGAWIAERGGIRRGMGRLEDRYVLPLVAGGAIVLACFVSARSIGYRGIFLIPVLPGLLQLSRLAERRSMRAWLFSISCATVFVMWIMGVQSTLYGLGLVQSRYHLDEGRAGQGLWLVKECCWWAIVTTLVAVVYSFSLTSPAFRGLARVRLDAVVRRA